MIGNRMATAVLLVSGLVLGAVTGAGAQPVSRRLVVNYLEAPTARVQALSRRVDAYVAKTRKDPGAPKVALLHEIGRPGRMAVVEQWSSLDGTDAKRMASELEVQTEGVAQAPVDNRVNIALTPFIAAAASSGAFHVLMHVDVVPDGSALASKLLVDQREAVMSAPGALGFEAATQADRTNHFAVHEIWTSRAAYETYAATPAAKSLRQQLATVKGAPFDDRFFTSAAPVTPAPKR